MRPWIGAPVALAAPVSANAEQANPSARRRRRSAEPPEDRLDEPVVQDRREDRIELDQRVEDVVEAVDEQDVAVRHPRAVRDAAHLVAQLARDVRVHPRQDAVQHAEERRAHRPALAEHDVVDQAVAQVADPLAERRAVLPAALVRIASRSRRAARHRGTARWEQRAYVPRFGYLITVAESVGKVSQEVCRQRARFRLRRLLEREPDPALADEVVVPDQVGRSIDGQLVDQPAVDVVAREDVGARAVLDLGVQKLGRVAQPPVSRRRLPVSLGRGVRLVLRPGDVLLADVGGDVAGARAEAAG